MLIIDSNPTSAPPPIPPPTTGPEFYPDAVYRINIDTDGDAQADIAFTFTFSEYENGGQTGTAWYATGSEARQPEPAGELLTESLPVSFDGTARPVQAGRIRLFAGLRSDPFFADVEGALHGFAVDRARRLRRQQRRLHRAGGAQRHARRRPGDRSLGHDQPAPRRRRSCRWTAAGTRPSTRSSTPTARKTSTTPASPPTTSPTTWGRGPRSWKTAATRPRRPRRRPCRCCPTSSSYDRTKPATYPNGRVLTDDVYSKRFAWLSHGKVPPTGLKPHDDLLAQFPYLGAPNPVPVMSS